MWSHVVMKRAALLGALVLAVSAAAFGASPEPAPPPRFENPLLETVVEMTHAGVPTPTILAFLRVRRVRLQTDIEAADLLRLRAEGVAEEVIEYISKQSRVEIPPPPPPPSEAPPPDEPKPDRSEEARPVEPDPGDIGLIMGVYDPIPEGGYPCWPPSLAPYDCGDRPIFVGRPPGLRGREARGQESSNPDRTIDRARKPDGREPGAKGRKDASPSSGTARSDSARPSGSPASSGPSSRR